MKATIKSLSRYKGETITFRLIGDDNFIFNNVEDPEQQIPFRVYCYPNGLDVSNPDNKEKIIAINYDETEESPGEDGYVVRIDGANEVQIVIPYEVTAGDKMIASPYTIEIRYGDTIRTVIIRNNSFILTDAASSDISDE